MVMKGQFLERPTLIPLPSGLVLEGVSHRGERRPALLVLPPPHLEGGGMDHVVGAELAFAVSRVGHPTLRFNYRGVAGSQGEVSKRPGDWLEDAREALKLARENADGHAPVPVQGNIDPALLAAPWDVLEAHVRDVVRRGRTAPGHVVNLGHGVPPDTDPDVLTRVVGLVHALGADWTGHHDAHEEATRR